MTFASPLSASQVARRARRSVAWIAAAGFRWASSNAWAGQAARFGATGATAIGVAVSTSPTGPFSAALGRPLVENGRFELTGVSTRSATCQGATR